VPFQQVTPDSNKIFFLPRALGKTLRLQRRHPPPPAASSARFLPANKNL
jgi:hypothetical protein